MCKVRFVNCRSFAFFSTLKSFRLLNLRNCCAHASMCIYFRVAGCPAAGPLRRAALVRLPTAGIKGADKLESPRSHRRAGCDVVERRVLARVCFFSSFLNRGSVAATRASSAELSHRNFLRVGLKKTSFLVVFVLRHSFQSITISAIRSAYARKLMSTAKLFQRAMKYDERAYQNTISVEKIAELTLLKCQCIIVGYLRPRIWI